jgi:hypothetical protein
VRRHNRAVRRSVLVPALVLATAALAAGCKSSSDAASDLPRPSEAFCEAAARYDERVQVGVRLPEHIRLVSSMAEHAPTDVADDAAMFLDALQRRQDGDTSVVDNPRIEAAVDNLNRRAGQDCGWYKREGL